MAQPEGHYESPRHTSKRLRRRQRGKGRRVTVMTQPWGMLYRIKDRVAKDCPSGPPSAIKNPTFRFGVK